MPHSHQLAGAMGLASWRVRHVMQEYVAAASNGIVLGAARGAATPTLRTPEVLGLNEVGVTDAAISAIWRYGPAGNAAAVIGAAEPEHLGADIAFVDARRSRILLYQAKIGSLTASGDLKLKSKVPHRHLQHLRRTSVAVDNVRYRVTGRIAVYQVDYTPFLPAHLQDALMMIAAFWNWGDSALMSGNRSALGYYDGYLRAMACSPCGVLAAPVPTTGTSVTTVPANLAWPWEFDLYQWHARGLSPVDIGVALIDSAGDSIRPEFDERPDDQGSEAEPVGSPDSAPWPELLREALGMPEDRRLYVVWA